MHPPERPEQIGGRLALAHVSIVEQANKLGRAERAGHHGGLVMGVVAGLTNTIDDGERRLKLWLGELHLPDELMEMVRERDHDFTQSRIRRFLHFSKNDVR